MRGDLTTAKATVARLEIDVSHYQGQIERLENSLGMVKSECESEIRRKAQVEVLLSNTQTHLETARGELAKKEQQYQQTSSKMRLRTRNTSCPRQVHFVLKSRDRKLSTRPCIDLRLVSFKG